MDSDELAGRQEKTEQNPKTPWFSLPDYGLLKSFFEQGLRMKDHFFANFRASGSLSPSLGRMKDLSTFCMLVRTRSKSTSITSWNWEMTKKQVKESILTVTARILWQPRRVGAENCQSTSVSKWDWL